MPVIVSHEKIQRVKDALASVTSNGQAYAACEAAKKAAKDLAKVLRSDGGATREVAAKSLDDYSARIDVPMKALKGNKDAPVAAASWAKAKEQVFNLYMLALTVESTMPSGEDFGEGWGPALSYAVNELPVTVGNAVKVASKAITTVTTEVAKVGGSVVWGVFSGAWPLILIATVGLIGYVTLKGKIAKAFSL
jgi:hypothetical protein